MFKVGDRVRIRDSVMVFRFGGSRDMMRNKDGRVALLDNTDASLKVWFEDIGFDFWFDPSEIEPAGPRRLHER